MGKQFVVSWLAFGWKKVDLSGSTEITALFILEPIRKGWREREREREREAAPAVCRSLQVYTAVLRETHTRKMKKIQSSDFTSSFSFLILFLDVLRGMKKKEEEDVDSSILQSSSSFFFFFFAACECVCVFRTPTADRLLEHELKIKR